VDDVPGGVVDQADGQRHDQLATAGLGQDPALQPGPDEVELAFLCGLRRYADLGEGIAIWTGKRGADVGIIAVHLGRLTASAGWAQSRLRTAKRALDLWR